MSTLHDQRNAALEAVLRKAAGDEDFRALCLCDPAAALKQAANFDLAAGASLKFSEKPDGTSVVLPPLGQDTDEISDEQLETMAGGYMYFPSANPRVQCPNPFGD